MTYFNHTNVEQRARVFDVDTKEEIKHVAGIGTRTGVVEVYEMPLCVVDGKIATVTYRYTAIHPIYGGRKKPCLFHCYGRISETQSGPEAS